MQTCRMSKNQSELRHKNKLVLLKIIQDASCCCHRFLSLDVALTIEDAYFAFEMFYFGARNAYVYT